MRTGSSTTLGDNAIESRRGRVPIVVIGVDSQSPPGVGRDSGLSTHVRSFASGSWGNDWYPAGATINAKCGIAGRSEETATLPKTGPNRPKRPRFVATRALGATTVPVVGHRHHRVQNGRR